MRSSSAASADVAPAGAGVAAGVVPSLGCVEAPAAATAPGAGMLDGASRPSVCIPTSTVREPESYWIVTLSDSIAVSVPPATAWPIFKRTAEPVCAFSKNAARSPSAIAVPVTTQTLLGLTGRYVGVVRPVSRRVSRTGAPPVLLKILRWISGS